MDADRLICCLVKQLLISCWLWLWICLKDRNWCCSSHKTLSHELFPHFARCSVLASEDDCSQVVFTRLFNTDGTTPGCICNGFTKATRPCWQSASSVLDNIHSDLCGRAVLLHHLFMCFSGQTIRAVRPLLAEGIRQLFCQSLTPRTATNSSSFHCSLCRHVFSCAFICKVD